ncbi:MAG: LolA family protein [Acidobacteriota bacterium]
MIPRSLAVFLLACVLPACAETVQAVLARMDQEASSFKQVSGKLKRTEFTAVLNDKTVENGEMSLRRSGRTLAMRIDFTDPNARSIAVQGNTAEIYYPKINTVQIYNLGKFGGLVDKFLVLGFGGSGKDIAKDYTVTAAGEETVNGRKTTRLDLVPKAAKMREQIKKVELWIPADAGHPVQQRFVQGNDDYYLVTYSDLKLNPGLADSSFRLNLPANVKKEYPQK